MSKACNPEERCWRNASREPLLHASPSPCQVLLLANDVDNKALDVARREAVDAEQRVQIGQALRGLSARIHAPYKLARCVVRYLPGDMELIFGTSGVLVARCSR